jgi:hypothetical protein
MLRQNLLGDIRISTNTSTIGFLGENLALNGLRASGLHVQTTASLKNGFYADLFANKKHRIEVKTAKQNKDGKFKICLSKSDKYGSTTLAHADYVLIQLISNCGLIHVLFIPASELAGKKSIKIGLNNKFYNAHITSYKTIGKVLQ